MHANGLHERFAAALEPKGPALAELSNAMVGIYKEILGRGPTTASSHYAGPDIVVTSLENSLTRAERTLVEIGEHARVTEARTFLQQLHADLFAETVEENTGRRVRAVVTGIDTRQDVSTAVFYLEPRS